MEKIVWVGGREFMWGKGLKGRVKLGAEVEVLQVLEWGNVLVRDKESGYTWFTPRACLRRQVRRVRA